MREALKNAGCPILGEPELADINRGLFLWSTGLLFKDENRHSRRVETQAPDKFRKALDRCKKEFDKIAAARRVGADGAAP